jgi:CPA2 family monovalent cation:H+ antiporter-2
VPLALGLTMFQAGEFAFVIGRVGVATSSIGTDLNSLVISVALVTMFITPFVSRATAPIYTVIKRRRREEPVLTINIERDELHDHVVVVGLGRMGRVIAGVLKRLELPFVAIELDHHILERCRDEGLAVIFGDASHPVVLEAAGLEQARLLVVTTPAPEVTRAIVAHACRQRPELHVVARAESAELMQELTEMGAYEVVMPHLEAGLEVTRQALKHLGLSRERIEQTTGEVRDGLAAEPNSD